MVLISLRGRALGAGGARGVCLGGRSSRLCGAVLAPLLVVNGWLQVFALLAETVRREASEQAVYCWSVHGCESPVCVCRGGHRRNSIQRCGDGDGALLADGGEAPRPQPTIKTLSLPPRNRIDIGFRDIGTFLITVF